MDFPTILKGLRIGKGWTQDELADKLDISNPTLIAYESGKSAPNVAQLKTMCDLFNVSADELLGINTKETQPIGRIEIASYIPEKLRAAHAQLKRDLEHLEKVISMLEPKRKLGD